MNLKNVIRSFPDFPKPGILFRDIMPILKDPEILEYVINALKSELIDYQIKYVAGIESRGFIFGSLLSRELNKGFIAIRKAGKLPGPTIKTSYTIEYGQAIIELQNDALTKGDQILIVDDLLATGGTAKAAAQLIENLGGIIAGFAFVVELLDLRGRDALKKYPIFSLVDY